jgi:Mrp family chromosome partitioning ATPase
MAAEQYRVAAARLQLSSGGVGVAVVTSAIKGEGKTTTVINLGYTLARDFGKRVLIVDCDFVYPELKCFLERPTQYGLIDYLRGDCKLEDATSSFSEIPCSIMPAGMSETDPTELLKKTDRLEWVFAQMREEFDYVLLNAPPILPVATMNVLERHVDFLLLVVRANQTSQQVGSGEPVLALLYERLHAHRESAASVIVGSFFNCMDSPALTAPKHLQT